MGSTKQELEDNKVRCPICGAINRVDNSELYISKSKLFSYYGKLIFCKQHVLEFYNEYLQQTGNEKKAIWLMCRLFDYPFKYAAFEGCLSNKRDLPIPSKYITQINSIGNADNNKYGADFGDSDKWIEETTSINDDSDFIITKKMIHFWGKGYQPEDYAFLEDTYKEWSTRYKCDTLAEEKTYKFLSLKELEILKARSQGKDVDKLEDTFRKYMSDANVTPRDANAANDPENMNALGLWIKDIEKYKPAEYFNDKKIYADYDKFVEYLQRFIFRPLKNLLTGSRDFDKEFNVENLKDEEIVDDESGDSNE